MELIEYRDVSIAYEKGHPVVEHVDLTFPRGTITALLGPNGSGKTTLMSVLNRIMSPSEGKVLIEGRDIAGMRQKELARLIASVPQFSSPSFDYTVYNMILWGRAPHISYAPRPEDHAVVEETIRKMEITHLRDKIFSELSGGEKQMVLISRAIAQKCPVILMDEPTTYLDLNNQTRILNTIRDINKRDNATFIITLHEPNHALYLADSIVMVHDKKAEQGPKEEMMTREKMQSLYGVRSEFLKIFDMNFMAVDYRSQQED